MDIFFNEPDAIPLPPDQVRILEVTAEPNQDGSRVRVSFEITPFQQRPNIEIAVLDRNGRESASFSVVEAIDRKMEFNLHLREPDPRGQYALTMEVFYTDLSILDEPEGPPIKESLADSKQIVDQTQIHFEIP